MTLPVFDYIKVGSLEEASKLAKEKGNKAVLMAGGTDVILLLHANAIPADTVIDIKEIPNSRLQPRQCRPQLFCNGLLHG